MFITLYIKLKQKIVKMMEMLYPILNLDFVKVAVCVSFYLVVVEVVYEGGEAPGLVLPGQSQHGNMANEYGVKEPCHFQIVTGTQSLEDNWAGLHAGSKSDLSL